MARLPATSGNAAGTPKRKGPVTGEGHVAGGRGDHAAAFIAPGVVRAMDA
jgi:hypothetical protein